MAGTIKDQIVEMLTVRQGELDKTVQETTDRKTDDHDYWLGRRAELGWILRKVRGTTGRKWPWNRK